MYTPAANVCQTLAKQGEPLDDSVSYNHSKQHHRRHFCMEIFGMGICDCSTTVRRNWGSELSAKGKRVCLFCERPWPKGLDESTVEKEAVTIEENAKHFSSAPSRELSENERLLLAVNRTTHAIRALVLFLFYQLTAATAAFVIYLLAEIVGRRRDACEQGLGYADACSPDSFLVLLALVIWVVGVIYSSNVGWTEIRKSNIPEPGA